MQTMTTHLWFDKAAREAAEFYVSLLPASRITSVNMLTDTPSGDVETVSFELLGRPFQAISAGPYFKFNPSTSLHVTCATPAEVDALWARLTEGGLVMMELGAYPFAEHYGWVQDKYGLSWQVSYRSDGAPRQVRPFLTFVGDVYSRAEEAVRFWTAVFPGARIATLEHYGPGEEPDREGNLKFAAFTLLEQGFAVSASAYDHRFAFNEAISFMVICDTQAEIDRYWHALSAVPEAEQCGWLKDRFGVSWQIVPGGMDEMLGGDDADRTARVTQAFLQMKKIDVGRLWEVYEGQGLNGEV